MMLLISLKIISYDVNIQFSLLILFDRFNFNFGLFYYYFHSILSMCYF